MREKRSTSPARSRWIPKPWSWWQAISTRRFAGSSTTSLPWRRRPAAGLGDIVKLTVYLEDLGHFPRVNEIMAQYFQEPYPARAAVGVAALPRAAAVEMDAILVV